MPEPYWPKRRSGHTLSSAERHQQIVHARCSACKREHRYLPYELEAVLGDVELDDLRWQMRCAGCGERETIEVTATVVSAGERQGLVLRRLVRIDYVRRPRWRDERQG